MYKSILVHVDSAEHTAGRIRLAAELASANEAHLTGLYVVPAPRLPTTMRASFAFAKLMQSHMEAVRNEARTWERKFKEITGECGAQSEYRIEELHQTEMGSLSEVVALHARYEDLVVVGGGEPTDSEEDFDPALASDLVMTSGRPVLVVPHSGRFPSIGKRVLLCWNAGREATRAVHDSMPFLLSAENVTVLSIYPDFGSRPHDSAPGAGIALCLARHGIEVDVATINTTYSDVAEVIFFRATLLGADLIVTGACGHSRTQEWVFGGVTQSLLKRSEIPCLMSH